MGNFPSPSFLPQALLYCSSIYVIGRDYGNCTILHANGKLYPSPNLTLHHAYVPSTKTISRLCNDFSIKQTSSVVVFAAQTWYVLMDMLRKVFLIFHYAFKHPFKHPFQHTYLGALDFRILATIICPGQNAGISGTMSSCSVLSTRESCFFKTCPCIFFQYLFLQTQIINTVARYLLQCCLGLILKAMPTKLIFKEK